MHLTQTGYEQQYQVVGNDGTVKWTGTAIIGQAFKIKSTEASTQIKAGQAVKADGPNTTTARWEELSTADPGITLLAGKQIAAATDVALYGVAMENINAGLSGKVASTGSICDVQVTSGAIAVGGWVGGSASAGLCAAIAYSASVPTVQGLRLGICLKAAAQIGTSGLYSSAVLVNQS